MEVGSNIECDETAGEKFIKDSPGKLPNVEECQKSCEDSVECQSITYLKTGWCSHFSTPCAIHKSKNKAVSMRLDTSGQFLVCCAVACFVCIASLWYSLNRIRIFLFLTLQIASVDVLCPVG